LQLDGEYPAFLVAEICPRLRLLPLNIACGQISSAVGNGLQVPLSAVDTGSSVCAVIAETAGPLDIATGD
jgi:hypothetical protein